MVHKLRTFLTLLGITIGIFAIISVFTIVDSLEKNVRESISSLGSNILYVQKWPWYEADYKWWEYLNRPEVSISEFRDLKKRSQLAQNVCYFAEVRRTIKAGNNYAEKTTINLYSYEYFDIKPFELEQGRYFTQTESEFGRNNCIIGSSLASKLFQNQNPIGKEIKLMGYKLQVIGVMKKVGKDFMSDVSMDDIVMISLQFGRKLFDLNKIHPMIWVSTKPNVGINDLQEEVKFLMRSIRRIRPGEKDNFAVNQVSMLTNVLDSFFGALNIVGWIIGGFSILVGGFGIANIMFVSVKERTHIIGIQKACGAKNYVIMVQYLYESVILALSGGILGLLLVFLLTLAGNAVTDFTISLSFGNIFVGIFVSALIGVVSGLAPAYYAAKLNPVEAINSHF